MFYIEVLILVSLCIWWHPSYLGTIMYFAIYFFFLQKSVRFLIYSSNICILRYLSICRISGYKKRTQNILSQKKCELNNGIMPYALCFFFLKTLAHFSIIKPLPSKYISITSNFYIFHRNHMIYLFIIIIILLYKWNLFVRS